MAAVEDDHGVGQCAVDEVGAAVEVVLDRGADFAGSVGHTGHVQHADTRETSTPLRGSLAVSEEEVPTVDVESAGFGVDIRDRGCVGETNRLSTSDWQRC